jgi:protein ImuA
MVTEKALLLELRERVRRIERPAAAMYGVLPLGVTAIDRVLLGGGLARGALHEILGTGGDEEDGALAAAFTARILGRLISPTSPSRPPPIPSPAGPHPNPPPLAGKGRGGGWGGVGWRKVVRSEVGVILWCLARSDLYGPGLAAHGLDPGRVVLVRALRDAEILWAMEEGLRTPGILAVVGEVGTLPAVASRRLQLAAEHSGITAFLLRRWRDGGQAARERALPNAAVTRWRITALPSRAALGEPGVGRPRWRVELLRCRGGEPASWEMPGEMEVPDATDHVSLAAALADRPVASVASEKFRRAG